MQIAKTLQYLAIELIAVATFTQSLASSNSQPLSNYHSMRYVVELEPNVQVDTHLSGKTKGELGNSQYLQLVEKAKQIIGKLPPKASLSFPIGTNSPIRIGQAKNSASHYHAIGFINPKGKSRPILSTDLIAMFDRELAGGTQASIEDKANPKKQVLAVNLIVRETRTKRIYLVKNINFEAVTRDAINASLNQQVSKINEASPHIERTMTIDI